MHSLQVHAGARNANKEFEHLSVLLVNMQMKAVETLCKRSVHPSISRALVCNASRPLLYKEVFLFSPVLLVRSLARSFAHRARLHSALLRSRTSARLVSRACSSRASPAASSRCAPQLSSPLLSSGSTSSPLTCTRRFAEAHTVLDVTYTPTDVLVDRPLRHLAARVLDSNYSPPYFLLIQLLILTTHPPTPINYDLL